MPEVLELAQFFEQQVVVVSVPFFVQVEVAAVALQPEFVLQVFVPLVELVSLQELLELLAEEAKLFVSDHVYHLPENFYPTYFLYSYL